jgi:hypothetical protein
MQHALLQLHALPILSLVRLWPTGAPDWVALDLLMLRIMLGCQRFSQFWPKQPSEPKPTKVHM